MNAASKQAHFAYETADHADGAIWAALAASQEPAQAFWEQYIQTLGQGLQARRVLLLVSGVGQPWQALAQWPADAAELAGDADVVSQLIKRVSPEQPCVEPFASGGQVLAMRLPKAPIGVDQVGAVVVFIAAHAMREAHALQTWAAQVSLVPALYAKRSADRANFVIQTEQANTEISLGGEPHAERLYQILRLFMQLTRQEKFLQMAFELCNTLAVRFDADRVSLGWVHVPYVRLTAISHVEKFDPQSTLSRTLESAMEEAADQSGALVYPAPTGSRQVSRAHESYALMQGVATLVSVSLRDGNDVKGVLCLEKRQGVWSDDELWELRLIAEGVGRPLADLHALDRWWGERAWNSIKLWARESISLRHSNLKLIALACLVVMMALIFLPWAYRVDATLTLRSKDLLFMPAPFDGYLRQVHVEIGDKVEAGQLLVQLDTRDLLLEESMADADVLRFSREAEKSQAARQFAEMQINLARQEQSASNLALVRHKLRHAQVVAPRSGVVVEGELKKNLGAPLRKGDLLLKLAQTDDNYLELEIDQVDVHEVKVGSRGEFALVGRPDQRFAIQVDRIDPASTLREGRNIYLARAKVQTDTPAWWRPGMGGSARIDAGDRPLIWVMTHRTVRFLRELFWI